MVFECVSHDPLQEDAEEGWGQQTVLFESDSCSEPVCNTAIEVDCAAGLLIEMFYHHDQVGADAAQFDCCPQSCVPNPVEGPLNICKDAVEVLLVLIGTSRIVS